MLEEKAYDVDSNLSQSDSDMLDDFMNYSGGTYICDAITEIADNNVSIYTADILDETKNLYFSGAYEEAVGEGIMGDGEDLLDNLKAAWYWYNDTQLYNNIEELIYNYAVKYIKEKYPKAKVDEEELEDRLKDVDSNDTFDDIESAVDELINAGEVA